MEYLVNIEKLLKRPIPRVPAPDLGEQKRVGRGASSHPRSSTNTHAPRERAAAPPEAVDRDEARRQRTIREAKESGRSRQRGGRVERESTPARTPGNLPHFDFTKPYEPTVKPAAPVDAIADAQPAGGHKRRVARATGALLGGAKRKTEEQS